MSSNTGVYSSVGTLYVATNPDQVDPRGPHGLFKTVDSGSTWTKLTDSLGYLPALAVDPSNPSIVYAGGPPGLFTSGPGGVFKSVDGGVTFVQTIVGLTNTAVTSLCLDPLHPTRVYAAVCLPAPTGERAGKR